MDLAGDEPFQGGPRSGSQAVLVPLQLVGVVPPPVGLAPTRGFVTFGKWLTDQVTDPPQPAGDFNAHWSCTPTHGG
ncbi:hypothetical protein A9W95_19335 [Mycobacterium sp. 1423905.2]|nr:hypothetical protein A9W95_19335 [Mycobacterium sp. 1423905.2]